MWTTPVQHNSWMVFRLLDLSLLFYEIIIERRIGDISGWANTRTPLASLEWADEHGQIEFLRGGS